MLGIKGVAEGSAASGSTIVVSYSAKPEGRAALRRGIAEAGLRQSRLIVVHTSPDFELDGLRSELDSSGVGYEIRPAADTLDPAEELLSAADISSAQFIVIGLRRRSPVGKLLLGSNAQRVLLDASCPVLAVKADPA
ncbi:MAG TPA: universal stress protein [Propionibacteriaceae bacterium]|nr:universal stress protein [Propionibacteriaceae bacterium]